MGPVRKKGPGVQFMCLAPVRVIGSSVNECAQSSPPLGWLVDESWALIINEALGVQLPAPFRVPRASPFRSGVPHFENPIRGIFRHDFENSPLPRGAKRPGGAAEGGAQGNFQRIFFFLNSRPGGRNLENIPAGSGITLLWETHLSMS